MSEEKTLDDFQNLLDRLNRIATNNKLPEAYRLRTKYYLEEIRDTIEHGETKLEKHFEERLNSFLSKLNQETKKVDNEEGKKKSPKRIRTLRDIIVLASASILGAVTTKLMDVYWLIPDFGYQLLAALIIIAIILVFAFILIFPIDEVIRWAESRRKSFKKARIEPSSSSV